MKKGMGFGFMSVVIFTLWGTVAFGAPVEVIGDLRINDDPEAGISGIIFGSGLRQTEACYGTMTSVAAGTGLTASPSPITTTGILSVNTSVIQSRVTGACVGANDFMRGINQAGTVQCAQPASSTGTVTSVAAGTGLTASPSPITTTGTLSASFGGSGSATTISRSDHNHSATYYDKAFVDALLTRIAALEAKLAKVSADSNNIYITAANLHVRNGTGSTYPTVNGLGNVIIGYNEARVSGSQKTGSHNLVVGRNHNYTSSEGIVAGYNNTISGPAAVVTGGLHNTASGYHSSVTGGSNGTASGFASSVSGGGWNEASGDYSFVGGGGSTDADSANKAFANYSAVLGGFQNHAGDIIGGDHNTGAHCTISGGSYNIARGNASTVSGGTENVVISYGASISGGSSNWGSGSYSSVSGGWGNTAGGQNASVSGGHSNTASNYYSSVSGGDTNTASKNYSSVSGGRYNEATGLGASVSGGYSNTASGDFSSVSGGQYKNASGNESCASCLP